MGAFFSAFSLARRGQFAKAQQIVIKQKAFLIKHGFQQLAIGLSEQSEVVGQTVLMGMKDVAGQQAKEPFKKAEIMCVDG